MCHQTSQFSGLKTGLRQADSHCELIECKHIQSSLGETIATKTEFFELLQVKCFISLINLHITKSFQNKYARVFTWWVKQTTVFSTLLPVLKEFFFLNNLEDIEE